MVALTEPGDEQGEPVQDAVYGGADPVRGHIEGRELIRLSEDLVQVGVVHEVPVLDQRVLHEPLGELRHGGGAQDVTLDAQVGQVQAVLVPFRARAFHAHLLVVGLGEMVRLDRVITGVTYCLPDTFRHGPHRVPQSSVVDLHRGQVHQPLQGGQRGAQAVVSLGRGAPDVVGHVGAAPGSGQRLAVRTRSGDQ